MEILEKVKSLLPSEVISRVELEGSEIIVYTKDREFFLTHEEMVREIVDQIKKRIEIRPEKNLVMEEEATKEKIKQIVPEEAKIKDVYFEPERSLVIVAAEKPGLVIGRGGETFRQIRSETFWVPRIERVPAIKSDIVESIRKVIHNEVKFRKEFLNKIGENIFGERKASRDWIRIIGLGGWKEVGRSCLLVETPKSKVLLDCGIKAGATNAEMYPIFNTKEFDYNELDAVIVSHSHLDHIGFIPALYEYGYSGPLYLTTPTLDLATLLWFDFIDVMQKTTTPLFTAKGIKEAVKHAIALEYGEVSDVAPDVRLTFQNAGHILGCVTEDTIVMLGDGTLTEIKNLCNPHPKEIRVITMSDNLLLKDTKAIAFKKETNKNLFEIITQTGNITVTPEHPFFVLTERGVEEIRAENLREGSYIAAPREIKVEGREEILREVTLSKAKNSIHIKFPYLITENLAQLVGYILGDGSKSWGGRKGKKSSGTLALNDQNLDVLSIYEKLIKNIFSFSRTPKFTIKSKKDSKGKFLTITCSELVKFFELNFPDALIETTIRRVPENITRCKDTIIARFLRGLYDAEASVLVDNGNIELTITSKNIAYGISLLLLRLGILSYVSEKQNYSWGDRLYRVVITDKENIEKFYKLVSFDHPEKNAKLKELIKRPKHPKRYAYNLTIPYTGKTLRYLRKKLKIRRDNFPVSIKHFEEGHKVSYYSLEKLIEFFKIKLERLEEFKDLEKFTIKNLRKIIKELGVSNTELAKHVGVSVRTLKNWADNRYKIKIDKLQKIREYIVEKIQEVLEDKKMLNKLQFLEKLLNSDVRWVKIKKIKEIEQKVNEVFDLYVPEYHSFISNNLISHNSGLVHLHIGEGLHNIVYAVDQKFGGTTLLDPAFTDFQRIETLITESTYGGSEDVFPPRAEVEKQFIEIVNKTMERNGIVLIPSFSVERAQEVMAILAENNFQYPVYLDGMIWDANGIFTAYPEYLSRNMQKKIFQGQDPFLNPIFKRIASQSEREKVWEEKPSVIISTSGMLIGGPVFEHLKALAEDSNNTLIFVGYQCVRGDTEVNLNNNIIGIEKIFKSGKRFIKTNNIELRRIDENTLGLNFNKSKVEAGFSNICSKRFYEGDIIKIQTENGEELFLSPNHPVLTKNYIWKLAKDLTCNDEVWVLK